MFSRIVWPLWDQLFFSPVFPQHEKERFCWHGHGGHLTPKWTDTKHQRFGTCAYALLISTIKALFPAFVQLQCDMKMWHLNMNLFHFSFPPPPQNVKGSEKFIDHYEIHHNKVYLYYAKVMEVPWISNFFFLIYGLHEDKCH